MPIRPENRARYGPDWPAFSAAIRFRRAHGRCECTGECGRPADHLGPDPIEREDLPRVRCVNHHGLPAYGTGSKVVLTVAHLCHTPECREHVKAMCQGCHLHYDRDHHAQTRAATLRAESAGLAGLFELPSLDGSANQVVSTADEETH